LAGETTVLIATRSTGKLKELWGILDEAGLRGISLDQAGIAESPDEEGIECHDTFEANSLAKARHFNRLSGLPTVADDSGLSVDALGGAPGVWSKRYSGRDDLSGQNLDDANNEKLLRELKGFRDVGARYSCAAAFVDGDVEVVAMGETFGKIVREPKGEHGFGYDPYFFSTELGMTFGEASVEAKQTVSHRGRAFRALVVALRERRGGI
jgi:XTP/dITP diphosphohydrolase